ncbi:hypothetical protein DSM112329_02822 [Paraconexibacter sp. AEG42_29]|uniref:Uncharacterized protein n=1 Tax=Paraconexibacter sp. AEG42_29 TaxID=2997339 RepID=A0AAU7AWI9_9ACTN
MVVYEIVPHVGVGAVNLGMSRADARAVMPELRPLLLFDGSVPDGDYRDLAHDNAFQVTYDSPDGKIEFIELGQTAAMGVTFAGQLILSLDADEALGILTAQASYDETDPELGHSYIFPALELSVWRPSVPKDDGDLDGRHFATIGIGVAGYWSAA